MPDDPKIDTDTMPDDLTLADMEGSLTEEELAALTAGDDPITFPDLATTDDGAAAPVVETPAAPVVDLDAADPAPPAVIDISAHTATIAAVDEKLAALTDRYDDGEMTKAEMNEAQKALIAEMSTAQAAIDTANAAAAASRTEYVNAWFAKTDAYAAQHPYLATPEHLPDWDAALKSVNASPGYASLTMAQKIEQAHRLYAAHYEGVQGKPLPTKPGFAKAKAAAADDPKLRTDPRPDAPTTLAGFTSADVDGVEDGKFAAIDRIGAKDPLRAERMVASLSEAEQMAYLGR